jgi:hypothetical protein
MSFVKQGLSRSITVCCLFKHSLVARQMMKQRTLACENKSSFSEKQTECNGHSLQWLYHKGDKESNVKKMPFKNKKQQAASYENCS